MNRPSLILVAPQRFDLTELFKDNAVKAGFNVYMILDDFTYPNLAVRLKNLIRKTFFNDRMVKQRAKKNIYYAP